MMVVDDKSSDEEVIAAVVHNAAEYDALRFRYLSGALDYENDARNAQITLSRSVKELRRRLQIAGTK